MAQVPMLSKNVQRLYRFESFGRRRARVERDSRWSSANAHVQRVVEKHANARFLNMADEKIFADAPFEQGVSLYSDSHHLDEIGARRYGEVAVPYCEQWLKTLARTH